MGMKENKMKTHKDLNVWSESMDLAEEIYDVTKNFPADERFTLVTQMRKSIVSVPSNIAEGTSRGSTNEFIRFLYISLGSLSELETQIFLSKRVGYISEEEGLVRKVEKIRKLILGLIKVLKQKR
jgi:four helix bundle protein